MMEIFKLRKFDPDKDLHNLFRVYSNYSEQYKLFSVMSVNSFESFVYLFNRQIDKYKEFNVIEVDDLFAGFVAAYDYKTIDGHIKVMIYIEPDYRSSFVGLAGIEFVNILFQYYNIHKVYTEVYGYNTDSIKYNNRIGLKEECRLIDYKYFDGKYWDVIYFSISRADFYKQNEKIINRFLKPKTHTD